MRTATDLYWLAGLLEGEGSFLSVPTRQGAHRYKTPRIQLCMTDRDVVERAARILNAPVHGPYADHRPNCKPRHQLCVGNRRAASWMMTLYCLLGERRQAAIRSALTDWKRK